MKIKKIESYMLFVLVYLFLSNIVINNVKAEESSGSNANKVIYLTFDDGPSALTNEILNILKKHNVKATFFLIGNQIEGNEEVVKRIYRENHAIGLHTYSHIYKKIYNNKNNFINEMLKTQSIIKSLTGENSFIIRFPWGSRGKLNKSFLTTLHDYNFKVYDWNADSCDGIDCKYSPDKLYREAIKNTKEKDSVILLMHCANKHKNTCKVLPRIIQFYKKQGYEFRVINESTVEHYFPLTN